MNSFGNALRLSIFGESHGPALGCTIDGLPAGFKPDWDSVRFELQRRAPRSSLESTSRSEDDEFEIVSGFYNGRFTGAPLTVLFRNKDARSADYTCSAARPSHADRAAFIKFHGCNDPRGGGMFSGRMTLPLVFCGALAKQLLNSMKIEVTSHIAEIGGVKDTAFDPCMITAPAVDRMFPLVDSRNRDAIEAVFSSARQSGTSVGGAVECAVLGLPVGIGEPFFDSLESVISHLVFSIPGVHGIEFGFGFALCAMSGHEANDPILLGGRTASNHSGGINGGLSNGMPLIFRAAFRPVPSISRDQDSIDLITGKPVKVSVAGRHDVCILPRGCAAIEAAAAIAVLDLILQDKIRYE